MEFLKTCSTNVQAIGGFEALVIHVFSVKPATSPSGPALTDRQPSEHVRAVEAILRQEGHLVHAQDANHPWLWLFRGITVDKMQESPQDPPVVAGYELQREQSHSMKAAELVEMNRLSNSRAPSSATSSSPSTPSLLRGSQPQAQQPQAHDRMVIYELFTSSVVGLISYHLVKQQNAVGLNYRTLLTKSIPVESDLARDESNFSYNPFCMTNINVLWTSSGTLLVSTYSVTNSAIHCLTEISTPELQKESAGRCLRIAPNGSLAKVVSFDDPLGAQDHITPKPPRKRAKMGPVEQGIERWKSAVIRWLSWKGYTIAGLEEKTAWVRIRIAQPNQNARHAWSQSRDTLWPRALCFYYDSEQNRPDLGFLAHSSSNEHALDWFATSHSTGFRDPLDVAQQWYLGKSEREKAMEAHRRARKAEEEAARPKEDNSGALFPSSPLNFRTSAYGDLQAASGVYPTPPDGVPPGTNVSHSDTPSIYVSANPGLPSAASNPAINVSAPQESAHPNEHQQDGTSPEFPMSYDNYNNSGDHDHLFEDMDDEDDFGTGVTEHDFDFFDEPEGDHVDMADDSVIQESKNGSSMKMERNLPPEPTSEAKQDMADRMTGLENAPVPMSGAGHEQDPDTTMADFQGEPEEVADGVFEPTRDQIRTAQKEPSVLFTPRLMLERISTARDHLAKRATEVQHATHHRDSAFDPITFNHRLSLSDEKYDCGRFSFPEKPAKPAKPHSMLKPVIKPPSSIRDPTKPQLVIAGVQEIQGLTRTDDDLSDSNTSSSVIEDIEDPGTPEPPSAGIIAPGKRTLPTDGGATPMSATSYAESFGGDYLDLSIQTDEGSLASLEPNPFDWPLTNIPPPTESSSATARYSIPAFPPAVTSMPNTPTSQPDLSNEPPEDKPLSQKDSIAVAQIVTDQIVFATLDILYMDESYAPKPTSRASDARLQSAVKTIFPKAVDCSLMGLISVPDVYPENYPPQGKGQQRIQPRKVNDSRTMQPQFQLLSPPYIRVRRSDNSWDLLPPAIAFWESLGLSPASAAKNVGVLCIYPRSDSLRPCLEHFMLNLRIVYEGCKLGAHEGVETIPEFEGGFVPWELGEPGSTRSAFRSLRETCVMLGKVLAAKHAQTQDSDNAQITDAFVIYMVNPFQGPSAMWELCSAFWTLFHSYGQGPSNRPDTIAKPDLVLQIVPIEYIASFDVPVILPASTYTTLAREVYDRCPPSAPSPEKTPISIYSAPCFQLEEGIPRQIPFKLQGDPPQDLLKENSYMHIAYAISLDGTWLTSAWTDAFGKSRTVVSYHLGTREFREIAKEIWATTIEICSARRVMWRICIAKVGVVEKEESDAWHFLSVIPTPLNLFTTLVTVDTHPQIKLTPTMIPNPGTSASQHADSNTPGSTPQPGPLSPDPTTQHTLTPAPTPAPESSTTDAANSPDSRLVDVTDESWGVILGHRGMNSWSTVELRPCIISGLLVKRGLGNASGVVGSGAASIGAVPPGTPDPETGPIVVAVNILWINVVMNGRVNTAANASAASTASPFPSPAPLTPLGDAMSPGGLASLPGSPAPLGPTTSGATGATGAASSSSPIGTERASLNTLMWTPTPGHRQTAETLLKEILSQYRALGTLARLKGIRGTRMGALAWHFVAAERGVRVGGFVPGV